MADNKKKKKNQKKSCTSPKPKGRPQKAKTLKEAVAVAFNKEITIKDDKGKAQKMSCLEALAMNTVTDAIANDGATRRMLFREDLFNLESREQEFEYPPDDEAIMAVETDYQNIIRSWAEADPKIRKVMAEFMHSALIDIINEKTRE